MTDQQDQDELHRVFHAARERDAAWTPTFERVRSRRPAIRRRSSWVLAVGAVAAAALVTMVVVRSRSHRTPEPPFTITVGSLRMPTDFLLDVAGVDPLGTVPAIGRTDDWFPSLSGAKGHRL